MLNEIDIHEPENDTCLRLEGEVRGKSSLSQVIHLFAILPP